jgi:DegV family protein with EDD domain
MAATEMLPDAGVSIIDTLSTAVGLHLMLDAATGAIAAGATRQEVVDQIEEIKKRICLFLVVDTLEYLAKGGRIGNAKAFMGTLLKVKPILALQDGVIEPIEQVRSKRKALTRMLELVEGHLGANGHQARIGLANALVPEEARAYGRQVQSRLGCPEPFVSDLGPVIGTHTGPGVIAIAAYA